MKKRYWIIPLIIISLIIILFLLGYFWNDLFVNHNSSTGQKAYKENGYFLYENIPSYIEYKTPEEYKNIPLEKFLQYSIEQEQYLEWNFNEVKCKEMNESTAQEFSLFKEIYRANPFSRRLGACPSSVSAYVCGRSYFVINFMGSCGPQIFGPFEIPVY